MYLSVPGFIEIPPLSEEIASRGIGVDRQTHNTTHGPPAGRQTRIHKPLVAYCWR